MKKAILTTIFVSLFVGASAQWNSTGDSKTTGNLAVGGASKTYTKLELITKKIVPDVGNHTALAAYELAGARDLVFRADDGNGRAILRSYTGGGWGGGFLFMSATDINTQKPRFGLHGWGMTNFYDKSVLLGLIDDYQEWGEGSVLTFGGTKTLYGLPTIRAYTSTVNKSDLRISMGSVGRVVMGRTGWQSGIGDIFYPSFYVFSDGNVAIGTADNYVPTYKLEVKGTIKAEEIRVETFGADFVFKDDYKLPTLQEVKAHIDEHKHLPGIASETEMQENGMGVSEIATKLLQKVEELTLYAIQQQELIDKLTNEVNDLKNTQK